MVQLYSFVWCILISKQIRNNLKSWRAAYLQSTSKMMKVEIASVPNHSLNQSITYYIVLIGALKKELKAEDNRLLKNSWKKAFLLWHHQCFLRSAVKGKMSDNLSNHYKMSDPSFQCIISFWKIFLDK